jgi:phage tail sheath gpL-like
MENTEEKGFVSFDSRPKDETPAAPDIDLMSITLAERDAAIDRLTGDLNDTMAAYRKAAVALNPELPEELITGGSVAAVDEAVTRAKALVARVKAAVKTAPPPPVAAPRGNNTGSLTAADKIRRGLGF